MAIPKKHAIIQPAPVTLTAQHRAAAELLLKRGSTGASLTPGPEGALTWGNFPTKEELRAALFPLPPSGPPLNDDSTAESLAHASAISQTDRRGAFVETGNSGKSRVNRSGHKP